MNRPHLFSGTRLIGMAAIGFGLNPLFARLLIEDGLGAEMISLYRFIIPVLLLCCWLRITPGQRPEVGRMLLLGASNGAAIFAYFNALEVIPAASVILIYYTYPVFCVLVGWLFFRRRPSQNTLVAALLILLAASLAVQPETLSGEAGLALAGSFLAPLMIAFQIQYLAAPKQAMKPLSRIAWGSIGHLLVLIPLVVWLAPARLLPESGTAQLAALGIAIVAALIPQLLFIVGAAESPPGKTAVAGALELIVAMVCGALLMGDSLGRPEITAMLLILMALFIRDVETPLAKSLQQEQALSD